LRSVTKPLVPILVCVLTVSSLAYALLLKFDPAAAGERVSVDNVHQERGLAYIGRLSNPELSDHEQPTAAQLYMIEERRGNFLTRLRPYFGDSFAFAWLLSVSTANYPYATYEVRVPLGPAHAAHDDIRKIGNGRFSIWRGHVYFSFATGSALEDIKRLEVVVPRFPALSADTLIVAVGAAAIIAALGLSLYGFAAVLRPLVRRSRLLQNIVPGITICFVVAILLIVGSEAYMRANGMFPKDRAVWAGEFVPDMGWRFQPGAEIVWTNGINYWTRSRANAIGFLDKEPAIPKPPGTFRIMVIGDSMVQAVEVPLEQRFQTALDQLLQRDFPQRKFDVVALGYSGTGQANQLPFFERFKDQLNPNLLVLVVANNDLANNSPLLEAIRHGWHPEHLPLLFFRKNSDGSCSRMAIDPTWEQHILPRGDEFDRLMKLREMSPDYKAMLQGWNPAPSEAAGLDFVFYETGQLPPAFEEAVQLTRCSFAEWKRLAEQDGLPLVVVVVPAVRGQEPAVEKDGQFKRIAGILSELHVPLLDLYPEFVKRGDMDDAHFKFDGHWTSTGHKWSAEAILDYLKHEGYLQSRQENAANRARSDIRP
jgi:lysophospholipase L1-like esterase